MAHHLYRTSIRCCSALIAAVSALSAASAAAQSVSTDGFDISGSFRARADAVDGQFRPGKARGDAILMLRTTLKASYETGPVQFVSELVDARVYGHDLKTPVGTGEINALEPLQAYVGFALEQILGPALDGSLKAGRLTMDIGSGRLIGRSSDSNFPTAYTGAMLDLTTPDTGRIQAFWTMPNTRLPRDAESLLDNEVAFDRAADDVQFYGANYSHTKSR